MTGRELLTKLAELDDETLDLPVLTVGVNTAAGEGVYVGAPPPGNAWLPDRMLHVGALTAEFQNRKRR